VSLLYLIKSKTPLASFGIWIALAIFTIHGLMDRTAVLRTASYHMTRLVEFTDEIEGTVRLLPARNEPRHLVPYAGGFFLAVAMVYGLAFLFFLIHRFKKLKWAGSLGNLMFTVGCPLQFISIAALLYGIARTREIGPPGISLKSNYFEVTFIITSALASLLYLLFRRFYDRIMEKIPDEEQLDLLCYKIITIAFPLLTLVIITGAAWAHNAWGRYWAWDPKETWSLITWFIYLGYLHARITFGWKGKRAACLAIIGFLFVIITFLGVSYIPEISEGSLHAYT
jgi:cytochrome c-type biogenesis protein CcsB